MKKTLLPSPSDAARALGSIRSPRKAASSRRNGRLGGHPLGPLFPFRVWRQNLRRERPRSFTIAEADAFRSTLCEAVRLGMLETAISSVPDWVRRAAVRDAELL